VKPVLETRPPAGTDVNPHLMNMFMRMRFERSRCTPFCQCRHRNSNFIFFIYYENRTHST